MSDYPSHVLKKGARVFARQLGKADITGSITWVGPSKYGDGFRYGVRADDGSTHWVDEDGVVPEASDAEPSPDEIRKGSRVRVLRGAHAGVEGDVYTSGAGGRFGVRDDAEDTFWADLADLEMV